MSGANEPLFEAALAQLAEAEAKVHSIKSWINQGCSMMGRQPMFPDLAEPGISPGVRSLKFGPDHFFNKPFATAVREVLTLRKEAGLTGPASIEDIHSALREGGFNFPSNDPEKQKQGLAVSLGKNTIAFRKLPSGLFGLAEWYGSSSRVKPRRAVIQRGELREVDTSDQEEAPESLDGDSSEAPLSLTYSADEDGREVEHDNMN